MDDLESRVRGGAALFAFGPILLFAVLVVLALWWDARRKRRRAAERPGPAPVPAMAAPAPWLAHVVFWGLPGLFLFAVVGAFFEPLDPHAATGTGTLVGTLLWLGWYVAAVPMWRAYRHRLGGVGPAGVLAGGGFLGLVGLAVGGIGIVNIVNVVFDSAAPTTFRTLVTAKWEARESRRLNYYVALRSASPLRVLAAVRVSRGQFDAIQPGRTRVLLRTKPGVLGYEHVVELALVPDR